MLGDKKPSDMDDTALKAAYDYCGQLLATRDEARSHDKFKKMAFPSPNPVFLKIKNEIENEMRKRKLIP